MEGAIDLRDKGFQLDVVGLEECGGKMKFQEHGEKSVQTVEGEVRVRGHATIAPGGGGGISPRLGC